MREVRQRLRHGFSGRETTLPAPFAVCVLLVASVVIGNAQAEEIASVVFAQGAATASRGGDIRLLGNGVVIHSDDVIATARRSLAILEFSDGTRMTVRPNTKLSMVRYSQKTNDESMVFRLFKGGLRAVTGLIARRNPNAVRIQTSVATIGIRGTDTSVRLCEVDCAAEEGQRGSSVASENALATVAKVAFLRGRLEIRGADGNTRVGALQTSLAEGDTLITGSRSIAVLAFQDQSRITLKSQTEFRIETHRYDAKEPKKSRSFLRLVKGGLRAISGLIAKSSPDAARLRTPTVTIGIRGTRYDVVCAGDCGVDRNADAGRAVGPGAKAIAKVLNRSIVRAQNSDNGVLVRLLGQPGEGQIFYIDGQGNEQFLAPGQVALFAQAFQAPILGRSLQNFLDGVPRPESIPIPPGLFKAIKQRARAGLWATVNNAGRNGQIRVTRRDGGESVDLTEGEGAVVDDQGISRTDIPDFMSADPYNLDPTIDILNGVLPAEAGPVGDICEIAQ